jgi:hypothetical protein
MSISPIQPAVNFGNATAIGAVPGQALAIPTGQTLTSLGVSPSTIVTLGAVAAAPTLFGSADLWNVLIRSDISQATSSPSADATQVQNEVASLLGLGANSTASSILSASGASWTLTPATAQAVTSLLQYSAGSSSQALNDLVASALGISGANASNFFSSSAVQAASSNSAFDNVLGANLELAAAGLESNAASNSTALQAADVLSNIGQSLEEVANGVTTAGATTVESATSSSGATQTATADVATAGKCLSIINLYSSWR